MNASFLGRKFAFNPQTLAMDSETSGRFLGAHFSTPSRQIWGNPYSQSGVRYRGLSS